MFYVYILQSEVNKRYYVGSTNDIKRRLEEHNNGKSRYARLSKPFKLRFFQGYKTIKQARTIERRLKKLKSRKIIDKIIKEGVIRLEP